MQELRSFFVEDFATDVRPEFFYFVGEAVVENQKGEGSGVSGGGAIVAGVVDVGYCRGSGVAYGLGVIKALFA